MKEDFLLGHLHMQMPFGGLPRLYDFGLSFFGFKRGLRHFLKRLTFDLPARPYILDVGCGSGAVTFALAELFPDARIYAFDIDIRMLGKMAELMEGKKKDIVARVFYGWGDILKPSAARFWNARRGSSGLPRGQFDLITIGAALEYVPLLEALKNLSELTVAGGCIVDMGMRDSPVGHIFGKVHGCVSYSPAYKTEQFERAGFRNVRQIPFTLGEFPVNLSRMGYVAEKDPAW